jgi:hypothetical protein
MKQTPTTGDIVLFTANGQYLKGEVLRIVDESPNGAPATNPIAAIRTIPGNQTVYVFTSRIAKAEGGQR